MSSTKGRGDSWWTYMSSLGDTQWGPWPCAPWGASLQCASLLAFSTYTGRRLCPKGPLPEPIFSSVQRANFVSPVAVPISAGPRRFHLPGLDRTRSSLLHLRALGWDPCPAWGAALGLHLPYPEPAQMLAASSPGPLPPHVRSLKDPMASACLCSLGGQMVPGN